MVHITLDYIEQFDIKQFQHDLINWFSEEKRDLPWRRTRDPYKVWVSEIMLQQTKVDTVIPYFEHFIEQFPTVEALANADEETVLKAWEGLGYYSRARNLHAAAKEVHEKYNGVVPSEYDHISQLRGIGPYTAGAILSIAYGIPAPAVDGNVMRVLARILFICEDIGKASSRKTFEQAVEQLISHENPSSFNQALMELGALICTPTSPSCLLCPVRDHCYSFHKGVQTELPIKKKKKKPRTVHLVAGMLQTEDGKYLIHKRPNKGLLANLWEFPNVERKKTSQMPSTFILTNFLLNEYKVVVDINSHSFANINHVFTHLIWDIEMFAGKIDGHVEESDMLKLVTKDELETYAFSVSHQKIWEAYVKKIGE